MSRIIGNPATPAVAAPRSRRRSRAGGHERRARVAAIALAAAMSLASGAAVADAYYLRGGIGLDRPGGTAFTDTDPRRRCSSTSPAVELGIGYATGAIRFEVLVEYRPDFAFEGRANFLAPERRQDVSAKLSSVSGMLAGFVDLAALGLPKPERGVPRRRHRRRAYPDR